jgi:predicted DNA-binding transcriptional regulator AlpA
MERPPGLISKAEVVTRVGRSFPTIWKMIQRGEFPHPRRVGNSPFWLEAEIDNWINSLPFVRYKNDKS